ncbi:MAG TPA: Ig-like domain repeat protein [Acidobacteriaceae bacterium]
MAPDSGADFTLTPAGTAAANVSLTPSASTITDLQTVSIAVAVSGASGQAVPTGSVSLAIAGFTAQQNLQNGAATLKVPATALSVGANPVTVYYSGDSTYAAASGTTTITVAPVAISVPGAVSVTPGRNATATVALSAGSTYSGTMNLTCAMTASPKGAQNLPTCSLNPCSVVLAAKGAASTTLTIQTAGSSVAANATPSAWGIRWISTGSTVFAALLLFALPKRRRRWQWIAVLLMTIAAAGAIGCGGGSQTPPPPAAVATTAGNYTFTVIGTDKADSKITTSSSISVTVQ